MKTLTIEIPEEEAKVFKEIMKKFNVKIIRTEVSNVAETPNALTIKTIKEANKGKGIGEPIKNVRSFIDSI